MSACTALRSAPRPDCLPARSIPCSPGGKTLQWLDSGWEPPAGRGQGRPRRRYYRLSPQGLAMARGALARAGSPASLRRLRPAGGTT